MLYKIDFPECAVDERRLVKSQLDAIQERYGDRVVLASVRLEALLAAAPGFSCVISLNVSWWGKMVFESTGEDPMVAISRALSQAEQALEAFVAEIPADYETAA
jgi:hypothetical protein